MTTQIKSIFFTAIASFLVLAQLSYAQENNNNNGNNNNGNNNNQENVDVTNNQKRFWEANLPGGSYMVALDRISAISKHSYIVSKSLIVYEVNIQTQGSGLVRFYAFEAVGENSETNLAKNLIDRGKSIVEQGGRRAGVDTNAAVEKEYPLTTHAQTIEFRLFDNADLDQLYGSIKRSWEEGRGRKFTIN
jgi:hypothetical protein